MDALCHHQLLLSNVTNGKNLCFSILDYMKLKCKYASIFHTNIFHSVHRKEIFEKGSFDICFLNWLKYMALLGMNCFAQFHRFDAVDHWMEYFFQQPSGISYDGRQQWSEWKKNMWWKKIQFFSYFWQVWWMIPTFFFFCYSDGK